MRKLSLLFLAIIIAVSGLSVSGVSAASFDVVGSENALQVENREMQSVTIVEEFNDEGQVVSEEVISIDGLTEADFEVAGVNAGTLGGGISTFAVINEGSMNYELIDTFKGDSKVISTTAKWVYNFGIAAIPVMFKKSPWSAAAGAATASSFLKPPATRYYTTKIYQAKDSVNYYGKSVAKEYTNSSRTTLKKTVTHLSKIPR